MAKMTKWKSVSMGALTLVLAAPILVALPIVTSALAQTAKDAGGKPPATTAPANVQGQPANSNKISKFAGIKADLQKDVDYVTGSKVEAEFKGKMKAFDEKMAAFEKVFEDFKKLPVKDAAAIETWSKKQFQAFTEVKTTYKETVRWTRSLMVPVNTTLRNGLSQINDVQKAYELLDIAHKAEAASGSMFMTVRQSDTFKKAVKVYQDSKPDFDKLVADGAAQHPDTTDLALQAYFKRMMEEDAGLTTTP